MKVLFDEVNIEDADRLLNVSNGILKAMWDAHLKRVNAENLGIELDDTYLTEDEIKDILCFNQVILDYLKYYTEQIK